MADIYNNNSNSNNNNNNDNKTIIIITFKTDFAIDTNLTLRLSQHLEYHVLFQYNFVIVHILIQMSCCILQVNMELWGLLPERGNQPIDAVYMEC